jgi:hypothetical protein
VCSLSLLVFAKISQRHKDGAGREEGDSDYEVSHFANAFNATARTDRSKSIGSTLQYPRFLSGFEILSIDLSADTSSLMVRASLTALASVCVFVFVINLFNKGENDSHNNGSECCPHK